MTKISVQRALTELKTLNSKIENKISEVSVIKAHQTGKNIGTESPDDFKKRGQKDLQAITDLIKRVSKVKSAIHLSNTVTKVTINGTEMTVLDAINRKETVELEKLLYMNLKSQLQREGAIAQRKNDEVSLKGDEIVKSAGETAKNTDFVKIQEAYVKNNEWILSESVNTLDYINSLNDKIEAFLTEVDYTLSESNAVTMIEVAE
jgi:hypothetical protein